MSVRLCLCVYLSVCLSVCMYACMCKCTSDLCVLIYMHLFTQMILLYGLNTLCVCRYVPKDWASKKELTVEEVRKLNQHNGELVKGLFQHTNLYTNYQHGNFTCIALKSIHKLRNELYWISLKLLAII